MEKYEAILRMWRSFAVKSETDIDLRLHHFRELFAYHSGKIENEAVTWHDTHEIFANGRALRYTGDPRALFEQRNQKLCYALLRAKIAAREPLSLALILETHRALTEGTYDERRYIDLGERPGTFKKNDYVTGRWEVGAPPDEVEAELASLLEELSELPPGTDILRAAAYLHARFEFIHPFADGNGRVGRTLLNYFLMTRDHPPVILHEEDKASYYAALESYDRSEELQPMVDFLREQLIRTWERTLARNESQ
ncbi:MAG: Fic family protein [Oscillospiraceae bacterium]|nr:Fic family protein [Oscillospiraceae bacterium]